MSTVGFIAATAAVFSFGSNLVPVKQMDTHDGIFFQSVFCSAIMTSGLIVQLVRGSPQFEPVAMIGGVLWATGNVLTIPIIQCIGLSLGLLIWGGASLLTGYITGRFGLFGLAKQNDLKLPWLNMVGIMLALASMVMFFFVKSEVSGPEDDDDEEEWLRRRQLWRHSHPLLGSRRYRSFPAKLSLLAQSEPCASEVLIDPAGLKRPAAGSCGKETRFDLPDDSSREFQFMRWLEGLPPRRKRLTGCSMAVVSGLLYGLDFTPPQYIIDNHQGSKIYTDYVFSQFCGIYVTSLVIFLIYCIVRKSRPIVDAQLILPAFGSGFLWSIGQISWFVANQELQFVVSFPIITTGPGIVGSLWGIFLFKEIQGKRNLFNLCIAFAFTFSGVLCISFSKLGI